jgi:hypothetical protein
MSETLPEYRLPGKVYDLLGRQIPRNPFRDTAGVVLLLRLPGFAQQFAKAVPDEYRLGPVVLCVCGELTALDVGEVAECTGGCDRWFLRTETSVRVARWAPAPETEGEMEC